MTTVKTTIPISEARKRIFEIMDEVQAPHKVFTLTSDGKPKAVVMSADEYESLMETIEVERIFPDLDKDIAEVKKAMKTGVWKKWSTLEDLERKWGMSPLVAEKPKRKYGVSTSGNKKGRKKAR